MRGVLYVWLELIMPHLARCFMRDDKAYRYLSASIRSTVPPQRVAGMLRDCGAGRVDVTHYTFGVGPSTLSTPLVAVMQAVYFERQMLETNFNSLV